MLESLTSKIGSIISKISGKHKINDYDIKLILKNFRKTLLDADVSWDVTKHLIEEIREKLIGVEITKKVSPSDFFTRVVIDEFLNIFKTSTISNYDKLFNNIGLSTILFVGLQGVGKTTSLVKLANLIKNKYKKSVLLVSCDIYRAAAIDQLSILAEKVGLDCFLDFNLTDDPGYIVDKAVKYARLNLYDYLIIDSAGRSHIDDLMMNEIKKICKIANPDFSFLVVDSIVGQNGVKSASVFCNNINVSGFFLTKMDSDSKGGVLLSLSFSTKKPIYFVGDGENITSISNFYPDRIVSRILGFGDISTLIDDIDKKINEQNNLSKFDAGVFDSFNLNDFKNQLKYMIELGGMSNVLDKMPGGYALDKSLIDKFDNKFFSKMIATIDSMTIKERKYPTLINGSRKRRISLGAGVNIHDVSKMLKYYEKMKKIFGKMRDEKNAVTMMKKKIF